MITYALCTDRTPNRATVRWLYDTEYKLRLAHLRMGAQRLDLIAIASDQVLEVGERIWHGPQAIGVLEVLP